MSLEVFCIDHHRVWWPVARRQVTENLVEHGQFRPAAKAVVERLVRPIVLRRILPLQAVLQHVHDAGYDPAIIDARHTVRLRKERLDLRNLGGRQKKQIRHGKLLCHSESHQTLRCKLMGPEPSKS